MNNIKVLDVTLRDGGCVNNFNFGQEYMDKILAALETSGVEIIELGYLDSKKGSEKGRTQFCNEKVICDCFLKDKKEDISYVVMMDYGKFNIEDLGSRETTGIDGIRLAFHKENFHNAIKLAREILDLGYDLYIQPMLCLRYSDRELLELIDLVNSKVPDAKAFYIVDSFGEMRGNDVARLMNIVEHNLVSHMTLGFHSHNNLQLAYSNAMSFLNFFTERNVILDTSVMGMGKGAGNLNTELLLEHLNIFYGKKYDIAPLLQLIDQVISVIHSEFYWGYSVEYYLSSIKHCSPSYAKYFYTRHTMSCESLAELLEMIEDKKKISFDEVYAENLYLQYNSMKAYDDSEVIKRLKEQIANKKVLIIAPGKSIGEAKDKIEELLADKDVFSLNLNNFEFATDYVLVTREELLENIDESSRNFIVPSNISKRVKESVMTIDYEKWILKGTQVYDSSGILALRLMEGLGVKHVMLAGFDGFSLSSSENYYNKNMKRPISEEQMRWYNETHAALIQEMEQKIKIEFVTKSKYPIYEENVKWKNAQESKP